MSGRLEGKPFSRWRGRAGWSGCAESTISPATWASRRAAARGAGRGRWFLVGSRARGSGRLPAAAARRQVKPARTGDAVIFYSMHPNATFDKHALHGGCPVKVGQKWVATKWIRDKGFANPFGG